MVNNSNSFTRQTFTLAHELGHILLGLHGVTDVDDTYLEYMSAPDRRAETACNQFAANLLLPREAFRAEFQDMAPEDPDAISEVAGRFSVSREVVLRRLLDEGAIDHALYSRMASRWNRDYMRQKQPNQGGDYYLTRLAYLGGTTGFLVGNPLVVAPQLSERQHLASKLRGRAAHNTTPKR